MNTKNKIFVTGFDHNGVSGLTNNEILSFLIGLHQNIDKAIEIKNQFDKWMYGQTVAVHNNEPVYYTHDFVRFLENKPIVD